MCIRDRIPVALDGNILEIYPVCSERRVARLLLVSNIDHLMQEVGVQFRLCVLLFMK